MDDVTLPPWVFVLVTLLTTLIASGGFWTYLQHKDTNRTATTQLLLGLAHDRIIFLGTKYIHHGSITTDEYEDFVKYLWEPYSSFGGNGLAERVVLEVQRLPIKGALNPIIRTLEENHERRDDSHARGKSP